MIRHMDDAIKLLSAVLNDWMVMDSITEVDWSRIKLLDFQELLRSRNELVKDMQHYSCTVCEDFDEHVSIMYWLSQFVY